MSEKKVYPLVKKNDYYIIKYQVYLAPFHDTDFSRGFSQASYCCIIKQLLLIVFFPAYKAKARIISVPDNSYLYIIFL